MGGSSNSNSSMQIRNAYDLARRYGGNSPGSGGSSSSTSENDYLKSLMEKYQAGAAGGGVPTMDWQFPQYSQTWAFTPPTPTPVMLPPKFDAKSSTGYYTPPKTSTKK